MPSFVLFFPSNSLQCLLSFTLGNTSRTGWSSRCSRALSSGRIGSDMSSAASKGSQSPERRASSEFYRSCLCVLVNKLQVTLAKDSLRIVVAVLV